MRYRHRDSSLGDSVASLLVEDLYALNLSSKLNPRVTAGSRVVNLRNVVRGVGLRRGDGTFGDIIPGVQPTRVPGLSVARGPVATIEIGVEAKILAKAMIKQIDRVTGDLVKQTGEFRRAGGQPICIGLVGVNHADHCVSYEGDRVFRTDGTKHKHPIQEAAEAEKRLLTGAAPAFHEFLILRFRASNESPYRFEWVNEKATELDLGAALTRVAREYDRRF